MEHLDWVLFRSWRGNIYSLDLINAAGIGDGRADLSRFSAAGIPSCFQGCRAGDPTEFTRCPGTGGLGEAKPTPGGVGAGGTPDARPRLSSTIERPRHLRQSGERSAGTAPCSLGVVRASGTPDAWPTTSATIERPRRRCGERPSGATRYSNTPDTGQRDGCRRRCGDWPPSLQKMPSLPLAGGRQEHGWPEPCRHPRQEIG